MIDISRSGVSWLDVTTPPPEGRDWFTHLRRLQVERENELARTSGSLREFGSRRELITWRFSYEMAREVARSAAMRTAFVATDPVKDWTGWFPNRLFGLACFRETRPGSIFKSDVKAG